jgi:hypothetical protein
MQDKTIWGINHNKLFNMIFQLLFIILRFLFEVFIILILTYIIISYIDKHHLLPW